jgi:hypothetical protein
MKEYFKKIEVLALVFIFFIIIFTIIYSSELSFTDAFYTAVTFQTFTGNNVVENKNKLKVIASIQLILSYLLVAIVLYSIL